MSELGKQFAGLAGISLCGFVLSGEPSKPVADATARYLCPPPTCVRIEVNPLSSFHSVPVGVVLASGAEADIAAPIIQAVAIPMIDLLPSLGTEDGAVHIHKARRPTQFFREASNVLVRPRPVDMPSELTEQFSISVVVKNGFSVDHKLSHAPMMGRWRKVRNG